MEILLLANKVPYPPTDGGAFASLNMALGLSENGANVTVLAMSTPKHPTTSKDIPSHITSKIKFFIVFVDTSLSVLKALFNLLFSRKAYNAQRFISKEYRINLESILLSKRFDLVQLEGLYLDPYIDSIRRFHKGPIAYRAHNVEHEIWERNASIQENPLKKWYFNILSKRIKYQEYAILKKIDILVAISKRDAAILESMGYNGPVHVSPTGYIFDNSACSDIAFEYHSIFHLGGLDWLPNQEGIIWFLDNCWDSISKAVPNAKFYIAGRNAPPIFVSRIENYPNVIYCGEVENSTSFIQSKGIMIVPLLSGSGMRIKIVEGMSLGKAILTTSIGLEGIDAMDGKHILVANTIDDFSTKAVELLNNKDLAVEIGHNAKEFASGNLNNFNITNSLCSFYSEFIGNSISE
jgi:glycosyltransferase involved in cell wall biosynthesis